MHRVIICASLLAGFSTSAVANDARDLYYMTEEYPPYHYSEKGEVKGLYVEMLKLMWHKMGIPEQTIHVFPWARGYEMVMTQKDHVLFAMART